jgi:hypothetical protein
MSHTPRFREYEFEIEEDFVPVLIYGDVRGLDDEHVALLNAFLSRLPEGDGHWSVGEDAGFGRGAITGKLSKLVRVSWMAREQEGARDNPAWAHTVGRGVYKGASYAAEVARDLYRGALEARHDRQRINPDEMSPVVQAYLETALWSSTGDDGRPLDEDYDISDFAPEAVAQAEEDCSDFMEFSDTSGLSDEEIGHNFWLTRNSHGAGFRDLGLGPQGDTLTRDARAYGSCDVYVGDDGKLYLS